MTRKITYIDENIYGEEVYVTAPMDAARSAYLDGLATMPDAAIRDTREYREFYAHHTHVVTANPDDPDCVIHSSRVLTAEEAAEADRDAIAKTRELAADEPEES